jgi:hypothetical protein
MMDAGMTGMTISSAATALQLLGGANGSSGWKPVVPARTAAPSPVAVSPVATKTGIETQAKIVESLVVAEQPAAPVNAETPEAASSGKPDWAIYFEWLLDPNREKPVYTQEQQLQMSEAAEMKRFASRALGAQNAQLLTTNKANFGSAEEAAEAISLATSFVRQGLYQANFYAGRNDVSFEDFAADGNKAMQNYEFFRNPSLKVQHALNHYRIGEAMLRNVMGIEGNTLVQGEDGRYSVKPFEVEIAEQILSIDAKGRVNISPLDAK